MASTQITDEELFSQLKLFGFTPGPVTENTRPVYLKKLKKLCEEQQQRGSRAGKSRGGGSVSSAAGSSSTAVSRPVRHDVTQLSTSRRSGPKSSVLGFSSDESDAEIPQKRKGLNPSRRVNRSTNCPQQPKLRAVSPRAAEPIRRQCDAPSPSLAAEGRRSVPPGWDVGRRSRHLHDSTGRDDGDEDDEEVVKAPHSVNGRSKLAGEYSDSDEEEDIRAPGGRDGERGSLELRRSHTTVPFSSHVDSRSSQARGHTSNLPGNKNMAAGREEVEEVRRGDLEPPGGSRSSRKRGEDHSGQANPNNHVHVEEPGNIPENRFTIGLRPRFLSTSSRSQSYMKGSHSTHSPGPNHCVTKKKMSVSEDELLLQFRREEQPSPGSFSGFSAHYLSMFLLTAACLFFLLLGLMYIRMRGSGSSGVDGVGECLATKTQRTKAVNPQFQGLFQFEQSC